MRLHSRFIWSDDPLLAEEAKKRQRPPDDCRLASVPVQSALEHLPHLADIQLYHCKRTKLKPLPDLTPMI